MATHPMSPVDAAWYHMDGPANPAVVTGILLTKTPLDFDKVKAVYAQHIVEFDRFRQRVVERGLAIATPQWEDVADFDIAQHVQHLALAAPQDQAALTALIDDIASAPLDHRLPLWQVHVIDGVDGGSALLMRYHHCIGDGTAMMTVTQRLFDTAPGLSPPQAPARAAKPAHRPRGDLLASAWATIERSARSVLTTAGSAVDAVAVDRQGRRGARRRRHAGRGTVEMARSALAAEGRFRRPKACGLVAAGRDQRRQGHRRRVGRQGERRARGLHDRRAA